MSPEFTTARLAPADLPLVLPLLKVTWPTTDLVTWKSFATAYCDNATADIVAMADATGGFCGLFASRVDYRLDQGAILHIPLFTVVDIGNTLAPIEALLSAAKAKAKGLGHCGVQIDFTAEQTELVKRLSQLGLALSRISYFAEL